MNDIYEVLSYDILVVPNKVIVTREDIEKLLLDTDHANQDRVTAITCLIDDTRMVLSVINKPELSVVHYALKCLLVDPEHKGSCSTIGRFLNTMTKISDYKGIALNCYLKACDPIDILPKITIWKAGSTTALDVQSAKEVATLCAKDLQQACDMHYAFPHKFHDYYNAKKLTFLTEKLFDNESEANKGY